MQAELKASIKEEKKQMDKAIDHLHHELKHIRTGKANPDMLSGIVVPYYGTPTPISQVANVSISDSKTLAIQPWDKSVIPDIERAIFEANLGLTPQNDGEIIRLIIPPLTEERRKELVKQTKTYGEEARVGIRAARHKALDAIKTAVKDGFSEDEAKRLEDEVEQISKNYNNKVEDVLDAKEKEILTV